MGNIVCQLHVHYSVVERVSAPAGLPRIGHLPAAVDALMTLEFLRDATNVLLAGPNGVGKTTIAQNIAHHTMIQGHNVLFTSAGELLGVFWLANNAD
jgi:hypothetical protein